MLNVNFRHEGFSKELYLKRQTFPHVFSRPARFYFPKNLVQGGPTISLNRSTIAMSALISRDPISAAGGLREEVCKKYRFPFFLHDSSEDPRQPEDKGDSGHLRHVRARL